MADASRVQILNGPNLNMLGTREPAIYGTGTLSEIEDACGERGRALGLEVDFRQSNGEGELVGWIQAARTEADGIVMNAGAYTHTSVAILDALLAAELPVIEVHLSNIYQRESFRQRSYVARAARGIICGFGARGYLMALDAMAEIIGSRHES